MPDIASKRNLMNLYFHINFFFRLIVNFYNRLEENDAGQMFLLHL